MADKKITIKDIARACGVGLGTASRAINNKPGVKADVRRKVMNYIEEIGWRSNSLRPRLQLTPDGKSVVFIAPSSVFEPRYNSELLRLLTEMLPEHGYSPVVYFGHCRENLERAVIAKPHAVVIVEINDYHEPLVRQLQSGGTRVIALGQCSSSVCPMVCPDAAAAAAKAVKYLRDAGHRKIGFLGGMGIRKQLNSLDEVNVYFVRQLLDGICSASGGKFSLRQSAISDCFSDLSLLRKQLKSLRHTAWICADEKMLRQLLYCARQLELDIPQDISVISFTPDIPWYCFDQDISRMYPDSGRQVEQVLELLENPVSAGYDKIFSDYIFNSGTTVKSLNTAVAKSAKRAN